MLLFKKSQCRIFLLFRRKIFSITNWKFSRCFLKAYRFCEVKSMMQHFFKSKFSRKVANSVVSSISGYRTLFRMRIFTKRSKIVIVFNGHYADCMVNYRLDVGTSNIPFGHALVTCIYWCLHEVTKNIRKYNLKKKSVTKAFLKVLNENQMTPNQIGINFEKTSKLSVRSIFLIVARDA